MFDIGFQELIMIAVVALIVVGPKRLPELAKTAGKVFADLKRSFDGVKAQVNAEMKEVEKEAEEEEAKEPKENVQLSRTAPPKSATPDLTGESELTAESEETLKEKYQE